MISFGLPWAFLLLPLPILIWQFVPPFREHIPSLRFPHFRKIVDVTGLEPKSGAMVLGRTTLQTIVVSLCWLLAVVAIAQPERVGEPIEFNKAARDVVLAVDISGSMDARDFVDPDGEKKQRLEGVRDVVRTFVAGREGERLAVIVFGSRAYIQTPLTEDLDTVVELLDRTEVGMAGPHTALGDAIGLSIRTFEASEIDQRLLIILSDGSDTASKMSPINAAEIARDEGVEVFTIGVGNPDATGEARVDLATLRAIASRTGGQYFFAEDENALRSIYDRIGELAPREIEKISYRPKQSLSWFPLAASALIGLLAVLLLQFGARRSERA